MLNFSIDYRIAIDNMTSTQDLQKYKLDDDEWAMTIDLHDTLKVC